MDCLLPFILTAKTLNLVASISEQLGRLSALDEQALYQQFIATQQATPQAGELNPVALSSGIFVQKECNR